MPTINDYKKKALNSAGYLGSVNDAEYKWLRDICFPYIGTIPDMWRYALRRAGFSKFNLVDSQNQMLKSLGYARGTMNEKWFKYWKNTPLKGIGWESDFFDADFRNNIFRVNGVNYNGVNDWLSAINGVDQSGGKYQIGPTVIGDEILINGTFDENVDGWSPGGSGYDATPTWEDGKLKLVIEGGPGAVQNRCGRDVTLTVGKAYRFGGVPYWDISSAGVGNITFGRGLLFTAINTATGPATSGQALFNYGGGEATTQYIGCVTNTIARTEYWDDFTVKEAVPIQNHNYLEFSGKIDGVTASSNSGNEILFQADSIDTRNYIRIVWDSSKHLRVIFFESNFEFANLDLGEVDVSTNFTINFSAKSNEFKANLNGGALFIDTNGHMTPIATYRIGSGYTQSNPWNGTINRISLFPHTMNSIDMIDSNQSFMIFGDSTANGDGSGVTTKWFETLKNFYSPPRSVEKNAQGGETSAQMLARVQSDVEHKTWPTIFMDRPNTGETSEEWLLNIKACANLIPHNKWFVVPPLLNSPSGLPDGSSVAIDEIQLALQNDPFFNGHTFNSSDQSNYVNDLNDDDMRVSDDWTHFNNDGQTLQASYIKSALDSLGW